MISSGIAHSTCPVFVVDADDQPRRRVLRSEDRSTIIVRQGKDNSEAVVVAVPPQHPAQRFDVAQQKDPRLRLRDMRDARLEIDDVQDHAIEDRRNNPGGTILRISAEGGEFTAATRLASAEQRGHASPKFLPDGRHFLFFAIGVPEARGVYLGQLGTLDSTRLLPSDGPAVYSATGHLLFIREGKLWAHGFDAHRLALRGEPFAIESVGRGITASASAGTIAYRTPPGDSGQRQLLWIDRSGKVIGKVVYPDVAALGPSLSPDGRRIAVYREGGKPARRRLIASSPQSSSE